LTADSDLEVRRQALSALNEHLRDTLAVLPSHARLLRSPNKTNLIRGICFVGDLLITAFYDGEVQAFDVRTFQRVWTRHVFVGAGDQIASSRDRVILASQEGGLVSIDQRGRIVWQRKPISEDNQIRRVLFFGNEILVVHLTSVERVDPETGRTKSRIPSIGTIRDADATEGRAFFVDEKGLRSLSVTSELEYPMPRAIGVSVGHGSVCVIASAVSGGIVTCLSPDTLTLQWTRPIASDGTWGHRVAPVMDDLQVLVPTDEDLTAFGASDGSLLWASQGGQEAQDAVAQTAQGFLIQSSGYRFELRNPANGEVRSVWPQIDGVMRLTVEGQNAAVADMKGGLWLVSLSACPWRAKGRVVFDSNDAR
jgi:outer membrane protein assembly factor BamB